MSTKFNSRVFGCVIIKSLNSNYNADFTHQPRTLPDGTVYATDKALKYTVRNLWDKFYSSEKSFYFKSFSAEMQPRTLDENYQRFFGAYPEAKGKDAESVMRKAVLANLLSCLDVRIFGATFAGKTNISIHGTCQITHGVNRFHEGVIYSEQIMSPFRNPGEKNADSTMTTLGSQSKLKEGHYVHHFSVNPKNIEAQNGELSTDDMQKLKEAFRKGATYYDSASKAGTENELLLWVELKEGSTLVLPTFVDMINIGEDRILDFSKITTLLEKSHIKNEIQKIEIYYNDTVTVVTNQPANAQKMELE